MIEETTRNAITTPPAMAATLKQRIHASSLERSLSLIQDAAGSLAVYRSAPLLGHVGFIAAERSVPERSGLAGCEPGL
jgi:hypothetical protein